MVGVCMMSLVFLLIYMLVLWSLIFLEKCPYRNGDYQNFYKISPFILQYQWGNMVLFKIISNILQPYAKNLKVG